MDISNEFLEFTYYSLTSGQQDIAKVKYHIAKNKSKSVSDLTKEVSELNLNFKCCLSEDRIRKIKKYEIDTILNNMNITQ